MYRLDHGSLETLSFTSRLTAWPLLKGSISRNAKTFSDSNNLREGMSPEGHVSWMLVVICFSRAEIHQQQTFYDLAKDTSRHLVKAWMSQALTYRSHLQMRNVLEKRMKARWYSSACGRSGTALDVILRSTTNHY